MPRPLLAKTGDDTIDRNFAELLKMLHQTCPILSGVVTEYIDLAVGANRVRVPARVKNPTGRIIVYQSINSELTDTGFDEGYWVINATVATRVKLLFF